MVASAAGVQGVTPYDPSTKSLATHQRLGAHVDFAMYKTIYDDLTDAADGTSRRQFSDVDLGVLGTVLQDANEVAGKLV